MSLKRVPFIGILILLAVVWFAPQVTPERDAAGNILPVSEWVR